MQELHSYVSDKHNYYHITTAHGVADLISMLGATKAMKLPVGLDTETYFDIDWSIPLKVRMNKKLKTYEERYRQATFNASYADMRNHVVADVVTKWIDEQPNNKVFGVSMFFNGDGYWITGEAAILELKPIIEDVDMTWILHNSKYDMAMFLNMGMELKGYIWDTMIMIQLIDESHQCKTPEGTLIYSKSLKNLGYHYLEGDSKELEELVKQSRQAASVELGIPYKEVNYKQANDLHPEVMKDYAIYDTELCYNLLPIFMPMLLEQNLLEAYNLDLEATRAVLELERMGIPVDTNKAKADFAKLKNIQEKHLKIAHTLANREFNLDSNKELVDVLKEMGVEEWASFTDKGEEAADKKALKSIMSDYPDNEDMITCIESVLTYRKASKLISTYIINLLKYVQIDNRVHCDYWISPNDRGKHGTKTGRLSSANPNLQNIPKKPIILDGIEFRPRSYFVAPKDYFLVLCDYDQQEYRLLGHYSQSKPFMKMIHDGLDIHQGTAAMIFDKPYDEVTKDERSTGKTTNFALVYGLGNVNFAIALGHDLNEDRCKIGTKFIYEHYRPWLVPPYKNNTEEVRAYLTSKTDDVEILDGIYYYLSDEVQAGIRHAVATKKLYFAQFPEVKEFTKLATEAGRKRGWVKTWAGRKRHFKDPNKESYKGPNSIIQGGCGDIMKAKLSALVAYYKTLGIRPKTYAVLSVHDEIGSMMHKTKIREALEMKVKLLEDLPFTVPITVGIDIATNWGTKYTVTLENLEETMEEIDNLRNKQLSLSSEDSQ